MLCVCVCVCVCEQVRVVLTTAAALDRETKPEHRLRVTAFDAGQPAHTGQLDVTVVVLDANDNSPVFEYSAYEVSDMVSRPRCTTLLSRLSIHVPIAIGLVIIQNMGAL